METDSVTAAPILDPTCEGLEVRFPWPTRLEGLPNSSCPYPNQMANQALHQWGCSRCSEVQLLVVRPYSQLADHELLVRVEGERNDP